MALTNMKMGKKEATLLAETAYDEPEYPYGLRISLDNAVLDKLGMKTLPAVGAVVEITARAVVQSVSTYERQDGEPSRDVSLQITDMDVTAEGGESAAQRMYANSSMNA